MDFEERLVSAAPARIYALAGTLLEYHHQVMNSEHAAAAGVRSLFELYGSAYYRHSAEPTMLVDIENPWSAQLIEHYNAEKHCHSAASHVLVIEDAIVEKSVVHCVSSEKIWLLYESYRYPDRAAIGAVSHQSYGLSYADFYKDGEQYLYIGSAGSFNYGHWLVDDLPRAKAWIELRRRYGIECIVILPGYGSKINEVRLRSLQLLIDPLIKVHFIDPERPFRVKNLHFVTPVSYHPRIKNPSAIHFVRTQAAARLPEVGREPTRRLFVARRAPNIRSIVNFDELWAFLSVRGFELIEAEGIDFAGQVALFQSAQIVVGQMGAAMTSTLFCRPATNLVYLVPTGWAEPFYLDLAALGGQQYNVLSGPPVTDGPPHLSDFQVRVDHLYHRLTYMGFTETANTNLHGS